MSFFDGFKHITPYSVRVDVGKNSQFITDNDKQSDLNYKGKRIALHKRSKSIRDLERNGIENNLRYILAEKASMPIDIKIISDKKITSIFEETSRFTRKKTTSHSIRLLDSSNSQVGYVSLLLTPSGDIHEKTCFYISPDKTEQIMHIFYNKFIDKKIIKDEFFSFQKSTGNTIKKIDISQRDGKVVGCTVIDKDREPDEEIVLQSMIDFSKNKKVENVRNYISSCVVDEPDYKKRGGILIPWECTVFEKDLLKYQHVMDEFQEYVQNFKEMTGKDLSIEKVIEIGKLSNQEKEKQGYLSSEFNFRHCLKMAKYLSDKNNNFLKYFKGTYIGNILRLTDRGYEACVVTKHKKDGQDYRLYTLIDLKGTSLTQGTGIDEYLNINRDKRYFDRLKNADKTPTFVTKIGKNEEEKLVLYHGKEVFGDCKEYDKFVRTYMLPFSDIKPVQINKLLDKQSEKVK